MVKRLISTTIVIILTIASSNASCAFEQIADQEEFQNDTPNYQNDYFKEVTFTKEMAKIVEVELYPNTDNLINY